MDPLVAYCEAHLADILETTEMLVRLESPSTDKGAVDRCGAELARRLGALGADVEILPQVERGDHLRARFAGTGRPMLILGHFDTVWPVGTLARMPVRRDCDRLFGPGPYDMKAGLVQLVFALHALHAFAFSPSVTPVIVVNTDEEIGSDDSGRVIGMLARGAERALVLEGEPGLIAVDGDPRGAEGLCWAVPAVPYRSDRWHRRR